MGISSRIPHLMLVACLLSFSLTSEATNGQRGYILTSSFNFFNTKVDSTARPAFHDTDSFVDIKMGFGLKNGLYFGGVYTTFTDSDENRKGYGPTIGFHYDGFFAGVSYLISIEHEITTEFQKLKGGSGVMAEVGYSYPWFEVLSVGANLSYTRLSYSESESYSGLTTAIPQHEEFYFIPMLQVSLFFGGGKSYDTAF